MDYSVHIRSRGRPLAFSSVRVPIRVLPPQTTAHLPEPIPSLRPPHVDSVKLLSTRTAKWSGTKDGAAFCQPHNGAQRFLGALPRHLVVVDATQLSQAAPGMLYSPR